MEKDIKNICVLEHIESSPGGSLINNPPAMQETWVLSLGWEDPLEKEMAAPTPVFLSGKSRGQRSQWATIHGVAKSWTRLRTATTNKIHTHPHTHTHTHPPTTNKIHTHTHTQPELFCCTPETNTTINQLYWKAEGGRRRGRQRMWDDRGWDGWMALLTRWTWVWVSSGSWWWTGRPGVLQSMGLQRVRCDWATELILQLEEKSMPFGTRHAFAWMLALPLITYMTLGKSLMFKYQFSYL